MAQRDLTREMDKVAETREWYKETLAGKVIGSLEKNNMRGIYVETKEEALERALSLIPIGSKVGVGGSLTLEEIGMIDALRKRNFRFIDSRNTELNEEKKDELRRESILADVFIMSTNALTMDGKLVNIDGFGNRVAALSYGPSKVIIVAGINKIVPDQEAAIQRIKNYVCPIHARRRDRPIPCGEAGKCVDCRAPQRFCNVVTIIECQYKHKNDRITVIICGEELGI